MPGLNSGYPGIPNVSGGEMIVADMPPLPANLITGNMQPPGTGIMSAMQIAGAAGMSFKNVLLGGDFSTNPWCRGTTFVAIANTLTYTADRFFALGGASSSISVLRQAIAAGDISIAGNTFSQALQFQRTAANTNTAVLNLGQALETANSIPLQGQQVTLSFWARSGANFSGAGGFMGVQVVTGTGTDQSAANLVASTWAGASVRPLASMANGVVNTGQNAGGNPSTGFVGGVVLTPANGVQLTTVWQRFQLTCSIPANATQIGVLWNCTPVGTAGANDWVQFAGVQLEQVAPLYPFASSFEYRRAGVELMLCQRYATSFPEPAATVSIATGQATGASAQKIPIPLSTSMRVAPTVTIPVAGTFRLNVAGTPTAITLAGATSTPNCAVVTGGTANTAGQAVILEGNGGTGLIVASAEL